MRSVCFADVVALYTYCLLKLPPPPNLNYEPELFGTAAVKSPEMLRG